MATLEQRFEEVVRSNERLREALHTFRRDPHMPSKRGCATCAAITRLVGEPFGCGEYRAAFTEDER